MSDKELLKELNAAVADRIKKMEEKLPLDFTNIKDYLIACMGANHKIAEHGLQHIPMSCYRNASHDQISMDITENLGFTSTALILAMNMIPLEQKEQFRGLLMKQMKLDLDEEVQRRQEAAVHQGQDLASMLLQFIDGGKPRSHGGHGSTH